MTMDHKQFRIAVEPFRTRCNDLKQASSRASGSQHEHQNPLGNRPNLDNQTTGPLLHQKTGLSGIRFVQINRKPERRLNQAARARSAGRRP